MQMRHEQHGPKDQQMHSKKSHPWHQHQPEELMPAHLQPNLPKLSQFAASMTAIHHEAAAAVLLSLEAEAISVEE